MPESRKCSRAVLASPPGPSDADGRQAAFPSHPLLTCHLSPYPAALKAVEPWLRKRSGWPHAVVRRQFSEAAVHAFRDGQLDFIYVDAGHEYRNVLADCRRWWPKLRAGGMLAGDDFADAADRFFSEPWHSRYSWGVKSAVAQFAEEVRGSKWRCGARWLGAGVHGADG